MIPRQPCEKTSEDLIERLKDLLEDLADLEKERDKTKSAAYNAHLVLNRRKVDIEDIYRELLERM